MNTSETTKSAEYSNNKHANENFPKKKNTLKDYFALMPVLEYFFKKRDPININVKMMHWTNKISIVMFLIALVIWLIRRF